MSEHEKSGEPVQGNADLPAPAPADAPVKAEAPPAENTGAAASPASAAPAFGSFGANRGSGLARGKRPSQTTASAASANPAGYKPTSIEVIAPQTEYKNPFTGETTVSAPRANEPVPQAAPTPVAEAPAAPAETPAAAAPVAPAAAAPVAPVSAPAGGDSDVKPELKILPPEQPKRQSLRWEAGAEAGAAPSSREERPTFRPDRERRDSRGEREGRENREGREGRTFDPREPRQPRGERRDDTRGERRDDRRNFEPRQPQPNREPRPQPQTQPEPEKKSGGLFGWFKGLFGGAEKPAESAPSSGGNEPRREGDQGGHRHRHRGGRGRGDGRGFQGENRGPRPEGQPGGGQPGEPRGEGDFGGPRRRRRRRGGRGRHHGDPRPEGQQGGGAI